MARSRRGAGRGSRVQTSWSGTTFTTTPSGVTIDSAGIVAGAGVTLSLAELGYISGLGTANVLYHTAATGSDTTFGLTTWAGTSVLISPGFTTLTSFNATYVRGVGSRATPPNAIEWCFSTADTVRVGAYTSHPATGTMNLYPSGGSICWWAFGTA